MTEKTFERKEELIDAALEEFAANRYEAASLNTIIKSAGISKGTFYYHFADKQALYLYLLEYTAVAKTDFLRERMAETPPQAGDIFDMIKWQARLGGEFAAAHPRLEAMSRMLLREKGQPVYDAAMAVWGDSAQAMFTKMIDDAIRRGDFREEYPRDFIQRTVGYLLANLNDIVYGDGKLTLDQMLANLTYFMDFLKSGFGNKERR